jgi:hypothetical protein|nr:hypothetical protein [Nitrosomonas nitrosa]
MANAEHAALTAATLNDLFWKWSQKRADNPNAVAASSRASDALASMIDEQNVKIALKAVASWER